MASGSVIIKSQGVDHFILLDNNSTDSFTAAIRDHIISGCVTVVSLGDYCCQDDAYAMAWGFVRLKHAVHRSAWVALIDIDEFITLQPASLTLRSYLESQTKDVDIISIPSLFFGSSKYKSQPPSVHCHFIHRCRYDWRTSKLNPTLNKYLARPEAVLKPGTHIPWKVVPGSVWMDGLSEERRVVTVDNEIPWVTHLNESSIKAARLLLFHYRNQARERYLAKRSGTQRIFGADSRSSTSDTSKVFETYDKIMNTVRDESMLSRPECLRNHSSRY